MKSFSILQSNTIFSIPGSALRLSPHSDVVFHLRDHRYAGTYLSIGQNPVYFIQGIIPIISVLTSRIRNLMKISKRKKKKKRKRIEKIASNDEKSTLEAVRLVGKGLVILFTGTE